MLKQLTQNEILDWDIQGINIIYNCINELNGEICDGTTFKEANVTDLAVNKFNATGLKDFTNYIFNLKVYNTVGKGPNLTITFKTKTGGTYILNISFLSSALNCLSDELLNSLKLIFMQQFISLLR